MKKVLFLPSVRPALMRRFLDSLVHLPGWDVLVAWQAYTDADMELVQSSPCYGRIVDSITFPERQFPYPTRTKMLAKWRDGWDVWASMDDDMELLPSVRYEPMVERLQDRRTGVVSGNWVKSEGWLNGSRERIVDEFVKQPLVNMAGGQLYTRKIVDVLLESPVEPYLFCDVQVALNAYVHGYDNFRYRGSMIIHRIMQKDGLKRTFAQNSMALPDPALLTVLPSSKMYETDNNWHMPTSKELTALAHARHVDGAARL